MKTYRCPTCRSKLGLPDSEFAQVRDLSVVAEVVRDEVDSNLGMRGMLVGQQKSSAYYEAIYERRMLLEEIVEELAFRYEGPLPPSIEAHLGRVAVLSGWVAGPAPSPAPNEAPEPKEGVSGSTLSLSLSPSPSPSPTEPAPFVPRSSTTVADLED